MEQADLLRDLAESGTATDPARCAELAASLGMLVSDLLVIAGHPVPADLRPPERDHRVMREFGYRAASCNHGQMAALVDFIGRPPDAAPVPPMSAEPPRRVFWHPERSYLATVLDGLIRNRGFMPQDLPFMALSMSTVAMMLSGRPGKREHRWFQLSQMAGPLGWRFEDLLAVAGEPLPERRPFGTMHCHHLGQVFVAAIGLTTGQLVEAARLADRLSGRRDQGAWRPVSEGFASQCPDLAVEA
jgi:hypothetical protein